MRRALVVLLLVTACTSGHSKALPTPSPSGDECQREIKNGHVETTVLGAETGTKLSEFRAPDKPRTDGLFYNGLKLPPLQVPVTDDHPGASGQRMTVHPPGKPAWTAAGRLLTEVNGIALVAGSIPLELHAVRVSDGRILWAEGTISHTEYSVVGVNGNDAVLVSDVYPGPPTLSKIDAKTAWVRWKTSLVRGDRFAVSGNLVIVVASAQSLHGQGEIQVLDVSNGKPLWKHRLPLPLARDVKVDGDKVFVDSQTIYYGGCG